MRWLSVLALAAAFAFLGAADLTSSRQQEAASPISSEVLVPAGFSAEGGVTWFCMGGLLGKSGNETRLVVTNVGEQVLTGRVLVFPAVPLGGASRMWNTVETEVRIEPHSQATLVLSEVFATEGNEQLADFEEVFVSALVRLEGPDGVAAQSVTWQGYTDSVNCLTTTSSSWHFAALSTRRDARANLYLLNPYPDDAVVDLSVVADDRRRNPVAYTGVVVPPGTLKVLDLSSEVTRRHQISLSVNVRRGSVAAGRLLIFDGRLGLSGVSLINGSPISELQWMFPLGVVSAEPSSSSSFVLYNPNPAEAEVELTVETDANLRARPVAPFEIRVPPRQRIQIAFRLGEEHPVSVDGESPGTVSDAYLLDAAERVVPSESYWVKVRSFNGIPIVAERLMTSGASSDSNLSFVEIMNGAAATQGRTAGSKTHVLVRLPHESGKTMRLALVNPSVETISRAKVEILGASGWRPAEGLAEGRIEIRPLQRVLVDLEDPSAGAAGQPESVLAYRVEASDPLIASMGEVGSLGVRGSVPESAELSEFGLLLY